MDLTLLGTGCPQCDTRRYGPANLVRHGAAAFLVDCGSGATQRLVGAGSSGAALDAVFLTHLHSDHIVDLFQLVISSWHQGRNRPQRIFGPPGTRRYVDGLMKLWADEIAQRKAHELRPSTAAVDSVDVVEFAEGVIFDEAGIRVTAIAVDHRPVRHAYGFVFAAGGKKLVFSGDTAYCENLIAAAAGADVLVHECFVHGAMRPGPHRSAEGLANVAAYHTPSSQVGKVAAAAAARVLVLNHFVPVRFDEAAVLAEVRRDYAGPIVLGEDLMRLDLETLALRHGEAVIGLMPERTRPPGQPPQP